MQKGDEMMNRRGQDIKGRATHITNIKKDNTDKLETIVVEVKMGDWVWHATHGWGKVIALYQDANRISIHVIFNNNRNAICQYKVPEDFLNGKISKFQHKQ